MIRKRGKIFGKKAALELSMTTIIIIVLAVSFLILGLILLRQIFGSATESITSVDEQLGKELEKMFADQQNKIVVYLGSEKIANIRAGTIGFSFIIAAKTLYGNSVGGWDGIQYTLELDKESECYKKLGASGVSKWFISQKLSTTAPAYNNINEFNDRDTAYATLQLTIPDGTTLCTQNVKVLFYDNTQEQKLLPIGGTTFTIRVIRNSVF